MRKSDRACRWQIQEVFLEEEGSLQSGLKDAEELREGRERLQACPVGSDLAGITSHFSPNSPSDWRQRPYLFEIQFPPLSDHNNVYHHRVRTRMKSDDDDCSRRG